MVLSAIKTGLRALRLQGSILVKKRSEDTHHLPTNSWLCRGGWGGWGTSAFVGLGDEPMAARVHGGGLETGADSNE